MIDAYEANPGLSASQLGRLLGVTRNTVIGQLNRAGMKLLSPAQRREADEAAARQDQRENPTGCRYMIDNGDGIRDSKWRWCCAKVQPGSSYCPQHHARCYRRPEPESEAA